MWFIFSFNKWIIECLLCIRSWGKCQDDWEISRLYATHDLSEERSKICTCHSRHHKEVAEGEICPGTSSRSAPCTRWLWGVPWWSSRIQISRDDVENIPSRENGIGWSQPLGQKVVRWLGLYSLSSLPLTSPQPFVVRNFKHIPNRETKLNTTLWAISLLQQWSTLGLGRATPRRSGWK